MDVIQSSLSPTLIIVIVAVVAVVVIIIIAAIMNSNNNNNNSPNNSSPDSSPGNNIDAPLIKDYNNNTSLHENSVKVEEVDDSSSSEDIDEEIITAEDVEEEDVPIAVIETHKLNDESLIPLKLSSYLSRDIPSPKIKENSVIVENDTNINVDDEELASVEDIGIIQHMNESDNQIKTVIIDNNRKSPIIPTVAASDNRNPTIIPKVVAPNNNMKATIIPKVVAPDNNRKPTIIPKVVAPYNPETSGSTVDLSVINSTGNSITNPISMSSDFSERSEIGHGNINDLSRLVKDAAKKVDKK